MMVEWRPRNQRRPWLAEDIAALMGRTAKAIGMQVVRLQQAGHDVRRDKPSPVRTRIAKPLSVQQRLPRLRRTDAPPAWAVGMVAPARRLACQIEALPPVDGVTPNTDWDICMALRHATTPEMTRAAARAVAMDHGLTDRVVLDRWSSLVPADLRVITARPPYYRLAPGADRLILSVLTVRRDAARAQGVPRG
ncbi:hypothetical protein ACEYYA_00845 [Paracoccus sp. p3-h83]|uniref:hypothetical protein n=1 Tax=Paracoccus sp. p3-h83 TaxID=3342805 RepID=UPI0035BAF245